MEKFQHFKHISSQTVTTIYCEMIIFHLGSIFVEFCETNRQQIYIPNEK